MTIMMIEMTMVKMTTMMMMMMMMIVRMMTTVEMTTTMAMTTVLKTTTVTISSDSAGWNHQDIRRVDRIPCDKIVDKAPTAPDYHFAEGDLVYLEADGFTSVPH